MSANSTTTSLCCWDDNNKLLFNLEGNIGAGKTSLLRAVQKRLEEDSILKDKFSILLEPLDQWSNVAGCNLIEKFYQDPHRWAFTFNVHVLNTLIERYHCPQNIGKHVIFERSTGSTKNIFIPYAFNNKFITSFEKQIFYDIGKFCIDYMPSGREMIKVYLKTPPELCFQRICERQNKIEEQSVDFSINWLKDLDKLYDRWLLPQKHILLDGVLPLPVLVEDFIHILNTHLKL